MPMMRLTAVRACTKPVSGLTLAKSSTSMPTGKLAMDTSRSNTRMRPSGTMRPNTPFSR